MNQPRYYLAYVLGIYFLLTGIYGTCGTLQSIDSFEFGMSMETMFYQVLHVFAGVMLLARKWTAVYLFVAIFLMHTVSRGWWLLSDESEMSGLSVALYFVWVLIVYSGITYYLFWLRKEGYYAGDKFA